MDKKLRKTDKTDRKTGTSTERKTSGGAPDDFEAHALSVSGTERKLGADRRLSERKTQV